MAGRPRLCATIGRGCCGDSPGRVSPTFGPGRVAVGGPPVHRLCGGHVPPLSGLPVSGRRFGLRGVAGSSRRRPTKNRTSQGHDPARRPGMQLPDASGGVSPLRARRPRHPWSRPRRPGPVPRSLTAGHGRCLPGLGSYGMRGASLLLAVVGEGCRGRSDVS